MNEKIGFGERKLYDLNPEETSKIQERGEKQVQLKARKIIVRPETQWLVVRGTEWSLVANGVVTRKDNRSMFLLKPQKAVYSEKTHRTSYEDIARPIWLTPGEFDQFVNALQEIKEVKRKDFPVDL